MEFIWEQILEGYEYLFNYIENNKIFINEDIKIPKIDIKYLIKLLEKVEEKFKQQNNLIEIQGNCFIVGDIHGNLIDLVRIINYCNLKKNNKILFLGDYVDRGNFSTETIILLFSLYLKYPNQIFLIRGNHEFEIINQFYGFKNEIESIYGSDILWKRFNEVFNWLPLVCIINKELFCVHGGITPLLTEINSINLIPRPILNTNNQLIHHLVWADPNDFIDNYIPSNRGNSIEFGIGAIQLFLEKNNLKKIIRGHQCVPKGIEKNANKKVYTVFSSSNYIQNEKNICGILFVNDLNELECIRFNNIQTNISRDSISNINFHGDISSFDKTRTFKSINNFKKRSLSQLYNSKISYNVIIQKKYKIFDSFKN